MRGVVEITACACLLVLSPQSMARGQTLPTVKVSSWVLSANGTGVAFKSFTPTRLTDLPMELTDETANGHFEYALDLSDLRWGNDCGCYRYYVVVVRTRETGVITRHKVLAVPSGSFEDQRVTLRLDISDPVSNISDSDQVSLSVASAPGLEPPLIEVRPREAMSSVLFAGMSELQIDLRNPSKQVPVLLPREIVIRADRNDLWKAPMPHLVETNASVTLPPNSVEPVRLQLHPNTWKALEHSFVPTSSDKSHTSVWLQVPYTNPVFQHREGMAIVSVPIRFRPPFFVLGLALVSGVGLGSLVRLLARKGESPRRWWRATGAALVVAVALELFGIFLVAYDSKFMVFNFDLDPRQTLPVLLLGFGNGMLGLKAATLLKFIDEDTP